MFYGELNKYFARKQLSAKWKDLLLVCSVVRIEANFLEYLLDTSSFVYSFAMFIEQLQGQGANIFF
jgi:hypothetical protein